MTTHAVEGILQTDDTKMTLIALHGMCTSTSVSRNNSYPEHRPLTDLCFTIMSYDDVDHYLIFKI